MRALRYTMFAAVACTSAIGSAAGLVKVNHPQCPENNPQISWVDYLSGKYPPLGRSEGMVAFVDFRFAKQVGDPGALKEPTPGAQPLRTDVCYGSQYITRSVSALKNGTWMSFIATHGPGIPPGLHHVENQLGDPSKGEIDIYGVKLYFDEHGVVRDKQLRPVGMLLCHVPYDSICSQY